ncbi:MAG: AAA family ATPase [Lachnospiraceae bacterium]|nr:AAA family ATPase [Lachnospiraceae bacterium]
MWIENIQIKNFGKFQDKTIEFSPGLNILYGENESGKTTVHTFLLGMLFGMEKARGRSKEDIYKTYEPWNSASFYSGSMVMQIDGKRFGLERNFYHKEKTARLQNLADKEELSVEFGDLQMLLGGMTKENYLNTYCIRQAGFMADDSLADALESYMADVSNSGGGSVQIAAAKAELQKKKKEAEREKKQLEQLREERIQKLSMEAELLKKDIIFHKNSELAEVIKRQEAEKKRQQEEAQKEKDRIRQNRRKKVCYLLVALCIFLLGIGFLNMGKVWQLAGAVCIALGGIGILLLKPFERKIETASTKQIFLQEELAEGFAQIKEQWKDKENRCYNIEEEIFELSHQTAEEIALNEDIKAYEMAMDVMERIAGNIYEEISDELHEAVSKNLSQITHGKYDSIILDDKLHLYIWENNRKIPINQLSRGTLEQAYLAIRLAVGGILMKEEPMPVLLDEIFGMYDDKRLSDTLQWLAKYPGQLILFSCQKRELDILERYAIPYHRIVLD